MEWVAVVVVVLAVAAVGAYQWKARQARKFDELDARKTAISEMSRGVGRRPED